MIVIIGVCSLLIVLLSAYIFFLRQGLRNIVSQLTKISQKSTNAELQLPSTNSELISLAQALNRFLRVNKQAYQGMQKSGEDFDVAIHNITHDLRTPLTVASGYSQYLRSNPELLLAERQELLTKVVNNLETVENRLEKLLEYNRVSEQAVVPQLTTINLSQLLEEKCLSYYQSFQEKEILMTLDITPELYVISDLEMLQRIIENLLGNILNHGQKSAQVSLVTKGSQLILKSCNQSRHEIKDYQQLFQRFYTEDLARKNKNAGLGLYITKELVELLAGTITLTGKDQDFCVEISFKQ